MSLGVASLTCQLLSQPLFLLPSSVIIKNGCKAEVYCRAKDSLGKCESFGILSFLIHLQIVGCPFRLVKIEFTVSLSLNYDV